MKTPPDLSKYKRKSRPRSSSSEGALPEAERVGTAEVNAQRSEPGETQDGDAQDTPAYGRQKPLQRVRDMSAEETLIRKQRKDARIRELEQELQASDQLLSDYKRSHLRLRDELEEVSRGQGDD